MADTTTTYESLLSSIDTAIAALITSPQVDYKIGNISVSAGQKLEQLRKLRTDIIEWYRAIPAEAVVTMQDFVNAFGEDLTEYYNEGTLP